MQLSLSAQNTGRVAFLNKRNIASTLRTLYNDFLNRFAAPDAQQRAQAVGALRSYYDAVQQLYQTRLTSGEISAEERKQLQERLMALQGHIQLITGATDEELANLIGALPELTDEELRSGEVELPAGVAGLVMAMVHSQVLDREAGLSQDMQTLMTLFSPCPRLHRIGLYDTGMYWAMFPIVPVYPGKPLGKIPLVPKPFFSTKLSVPDRVLPVVGVRFLLGMSPLASCLSGFSRSLFAQASKSFWVLVEDTAYGLYAGGRARGTRPALDPFTPGAAVLTSAVARLTKEEEEHSDSVIRAFGQTMYEHGIIASQQDMSTNPIDGQYLVDKGIIGKYDPMTEEWASGGIFNHILASQSVQRYNDEREIGSARGAGFMDYYFGGFSWGQLWGSPVSVFMPGIGRAYKDGRKFDQLAQAIPFGLAELYLRLTHDDRTGGLYPVDPNLVASFANSYSDAVLVTAIILELQRLNINVEDLDRLNITQEVRDQIRTIGRAAASGQIQIEKQEVADLQQRAREYSRRAEVEEYQTGPLQPFTMDKMERPWHETYGREVTAVYTVFNVPTIVTSDEFKRQTSALEERPQDRAIREEVEAAEAAARQPQFTPKEQERIQVRRLPLWQRFINAVRGIIWRDMTRSRTLNLLIKGGILAGAAIFLGLFVVPVPVILAFLLPTVIVKSLDIHRMLMSMLPDTTPRPIRWLFGALFWVGIAGLLVAIWGAMFIAPWPVLFVWLGGVVLPWLVSHFFIYAAASVVLYPLLRGIENLFARRVEGADVFNRIYNWLTAPGRSPIVNNIGYVASRALLFVTYAYFAARVMIRFGARLATIVLPSTGTRARSVRAWILGEERITPGGGVTWKAPGQKGLDEDRQTADERVYIGTLLQRAEARGLVSTREAQPGVLDLIKQQMARAPPAANVKIRVVDLGNQLGIPRFEGATSATDLIYGYGTVEDGALVITVTKAFYLRHLSRNTHLFAELIDHEYTENIEGKSHAEAARHAWQFSNNKYGISEFHKFYLDLLAQKGEVEALKTFRERPYHPNDPEGRFFNYATITAANFATNTRNRRLIVAGMGVMAILAGVMTAAIPASGIAQVAAVPSPAVTRNFYNHREIQRTSDSAGMDSAQLHIIENQSTEFGPVMNLAMLRQNRAEVLVSGKVMAYLELEKTRLAATQGTVFTYQKKINQLLEKRAKGELKGEALWREFKEAVLGQVRAEAEYVRQHIALLEGEIRKLREQLGIIGSQEELEAYEAEMLKAKLLLDELNINLAIYEDLARLGSYLPLPMAILPGPGIVDMRRSLPPIPNTEPRLSAQERQEAIKRVRQGIIALLGCEDKIAEVNIGLWKTQSDRIEALVAQSVAATGRLGEVRLLRRQIEVAKKQQAAFKAQQVAVLAEGGNQREVVKTSGAVFEELLLLQRTNETEQLAILQRTQRLYDKGRAATESELVEAQASYALATYDSTRLSYTKNVNRTMIELGLMTPLYDSAMQSVPFDPTSPLPGMTRELLTALMPTSTPGASLFTWQALIEIRMPGLSRRPLADELSQLQQGVAGIGEDWDRAIEMDIAALKKNIGLIRDYAQRTSRLYDSQAISGDEFMRAQDMLRQTETMTQTINMLERLAALRRASSEEEFNAAYASYQESIIDVVKAELNRTSGLISDRRRTLIGQATVLTDEESEGIKAEIEILGIRQQQLKDTVTFYEERLKNGFSIAPAGSEVGATPILERLKEGDPRLPENRAGLIGYARIKDRYGNTREVPLFKSGFGYLSYATEDPHFYGAKEDIGRQLKYISRRGTWLPKDSVRLCSATFKDIGGLGGISQADQRQLETNHLWVAVSGVRHPTFSSAQSGEFYIKDMQGAVNFRPSWEVIGYDPDPARPDNLIVVNQITQSQSCAYKRADTEDTVTEPRDIPLGVIVRSVPMSSIEAVRRGEDVTLLWKAPQYDENGRGNFGDIFGHGQIIKTAQGDFMVEIEGKPNDTNPPQLVLTPMPAKEAERAPAPKPQAPPRPEAPAAPKVEAPPAPSQLARNLGIAAIIAAGSALVLWLYRRRQSKTTPAETTPATSVLRRSNEDSLAMAPKPAAGSRNLEIGCGPHSTVTLAGLVDRTEGARLTAIDVDPAAVRWATETFAGRPNISTRQANARNLVAELGQGQFDNAYALQTIHMSGSGPVQREVIEQVYGSLKEGGTFTFNVPVIITEQSDRTARLFYFGITARSDRRPKFAKPSLEGVESAKEIAERIASERGVDLAEYAKTPREGRYVALDTEVYNSILDETGFKTEAPVVRDYNTTLGELAEMMQMYPESILPDVPEDIAREAVRLSCESALAKFGRDTPVKRQWTTFVARKPAAPAVVAKRPTAEEVIRVHDHVLSTELDEIFREGRRLNDILREASFAETACPIAAPSALKLGRIANEGRKTSLVIGIPNESATQEMIDAVKQKLVALGRSDVLVISVDRDDMQAKLDKIGVPYGVILDVENSKDVDRMLEPFMAELDLQGLFRDYPVLKNLIWIIPNEVSQRSQSSGSRRTSKEVTAFGTAIKKQITAIKIGRNTLIAIMKDPRLLPKITALNLDYLFSQDINACSKRHPVKKAKTKPKMWFTGIDLFMDKKNWNLNLCNLFFNPLRRNPRSLPPTAASPGIGFRSCEIHAADRISASGRELRPLGRRGSTRRNHKK